MTKHNSEISSLQNLGPKSEKWLNEAGIYTLNDLKKLGAVKAFLKVKQLVKKPSLNLLYAIEGALIDTQWNKLSKDDRARLLFELDDYEHNSN